MDKGSGTRARPRIRGRRDHFQTNGRIARNENPMPPKNTVNRCNETTRISRTYRVSRYLLAAYKLYEFGYLNKTNVKYNFKVLK